MNHTHGSPVIFVEPTVTATG